MEKNNLIKIVYLRCGRCERRSKVDLDVYEKNHIINCDKCGNVMRVIADGVRRKSFWEKFFE